MADTTGSSGLSTEQEFRLRLFQQQLEGITLDQAKDLLVAQQKAFLVYQRQVARMIRERL